MKKYHKDYKMITFSSSESGGKIYRYEGEYYMFPVEQETQKEIFIKNIVFCFLYLLLFILAGLLNNNGSRNAFIAVPYVFLFLWNVYLVLGAFASLQIKGKMERIVYDKSLARMGRSCNAMLINSLYLLGAEGIYLITRYKNIEIVREIVFLCIVLVIFFCTAVQKRYLQKLKKKVIICKNNYDEVPIGK